MLDKLFMGWLGFDKKVKQVRYNFGKLVNLQGVELLKNNKFHKK